MRTKRIWAIISLLLAAFMLLSACGAKDAPAVEAPAAPAAPVEPAPASETKPAEPPAEPAAPAEPAEASDAPSGELSGEPSDAPAENPAVAAALAASDELLVPPTFPDDAKIVSATTYSLYTKNPDSMQDAVIKATLYWDVTNDKVFDIRFIQPMLPSSGSEGWASIGDDALKAKLGDAVVTLETTAYGQTSTATFAKYILIGDIVWTGEVGTGVDGGSAMTYAANIGGSPVQLLAYVGTQEGGKWFVDSAEKPAALLGSADAADVVESVSIPYKENSGHGVFFWMSDILFPGNMQAIKDFVIENGFDYDYYADGGITKNADGYWQTVDAVSGATLDETPTYLDVLKTLYNDIQAGNVVQEN